METFDGRQELMRWRRMSAVHPVTRLPTCIFRKRDSYAGSHANVKIDSKTISLNKNEHRATYLKEEFPALTLGRGRLEISVNLMIAGTALVEVAPFKFTSIPLGSSLYAFDWRSSQLGLTTRGTLTLWTEGFLIVGFLRITEVNGLPIVAELSTIHAFATADMRLGFQYFSSGQAFESQPASVFTLSNDPIPNIDQTNFGGTYVVTFVQSRTVANGTYSASRIK
jgi:hypothetical protein